MKMFRYNFFLVIKSVVLALCFCEHCSRTITKDLDNVYETEQQFKSPENNIRL